MFKPVFHSTAAYLTGFIVLLMIGTIPVLGARDEIQWKETVEDTMKEAEKTGKPIMMDFYTDW